MTDRDITDLSRELLAIDASAIGGSIIVDGVDGVDVLETVRAAQGVARAVIELTAERDAYREENTRLREQAARVKALADRLDAEAGELYEYSGGMSDESEWLEATATRIRTALDGETND